MIILSFGQPPNLLLYGISHSLRIDATIESGVLTAARRMLTHSSGMGYFFMDPLMTRYHELQGSPPVVQTLHQYQFLLFEPGERWMYSPGIDWAGVAVGSNVPHYS